MPQFQTQVPHPLIDDTPCLLTPGGVAAPPIRVLLVILISQLRLEGPTVQVEFDDIASGEFLLWQAGKEEFIDDPRTGDANRTLLESLRMSRYHDAAQHRLWPHRHRLAVVETACHLALRALLDLIGRQMQTSLDEGMIKDGVVFASCHIGKANQVGEYSSRAILAVEPQQSMLFQALVRREVPTDGAEALTQFLPVVPVPAGAK